jgi:hypothetical protein
MKLHALVRAVVVALVSRRETRGARMVVRFVRRTYRYCTRQTRQPVLRHCVFRVNVKTTDAIRVSCVCVNLKQDHTAVQLRSCGRVPGARGARLHDYSLLASSSYFINNRQPNGSL